MVTNAHYYLTKNLFSGHIVDVGVGPKDYVAASTRSI